MTPMTDKDFKAAVNYNAVVAPGPLKEVLKSLPKAASPVVMVKLGDIHILPGHNPRIPGPKLEAKIEYLADSMLQNGFYADKPLAGFVAEVEGAAVIYIEDGLSRFMAAKLAVSKGLALEEVPMIMKPKDATARERTIALITSNEGEPFGPLEKAVMVKRLSDSTVGDDGVEVPGMTDTEIAAVMRVSPAYIGQLRVLSGAGKRLRQMVLNDEVAATRVFEAMRKHGDKAAEVLQASLDAAKEKGKASATAKDDPELAKVARQKQFGPNLYTLMAKLVEQLDVTSWPEDLKNEVDTVLFNVENVPPPKEPKAPKVKKEKKAKKAKEPKPAKKVTAKKVAAKKAGKKKGDAPPAPAPEAMAEAPVAEVVADQVVVQDAPL